MNNLINVLTVDDDHRYVAIQAEKAAYFGINLIHCPYWDQAYEWISSTPNEFDFIVLDGRGQINAGTESSDINHLKKALRELNILEGKGIVIPYAVNTGYSESAAIGFGVKVYLKGTEETQLYQHIQEVAAEGLAYRMRASFPKVMPVFEDRLLGNAAKELFSQVFAKVNSESLHQDCRNEMRKLLEAFCMGLGKIGVMDQRIAGNPGRPNLTCCDYFIGGGTAFYPSKDKLEIKFTSDPNQFPERIGHCFSFVLASTNRGSHFDAEDNCSPQLTKALFYAMVEILEWLSDYTNQFPDVKVNRSTIRIVTT